MTAGYGAAARGARPAPSASPSPSAFGPASRGARTLRWARVLYYAAWAPLLLYAMYVQLVVLKRRGRVPIPASVRFGRDTVLLTFHGNLHCTWYALACLLHAYVLLRRSTRAAPQPPSALFAALEAATHRYTAALFALGQFVGGGYYLLLHFLPVTRIRARMIPDYDAKMALLHLGPALFVLGDALLKDYALARRHGMRPREAARAIALYGAAYFSWTVFCFTRNGGVWPYPFQPHLSAVQHMLLLAGAMGAGGYLARYACGICATIDRRRRRRILLDARAAAAAAAAAAASRSG